MNGSDPIPACTELAGEGPPVVEESVTLVRAARFGMKNGKGAVVVGRGLKEEGDRFESANASFDGVGIEAKGEMEELKAANGDLVEEDAVTGRATTGDTMAADNSGVGGTAASRSNGLGIEGSVDAIPVSVCGAGVCRRGGGTSVRVCNFFSSVSSGTRSSSPMSTSVGEGGISLSSSTSSSLVFITCLPLACILIVSGSRSNGVGGSTPDEEDPSVGVPGGKGDCSASLRSTSAWQAGSAATRSS